MEGLGACCKHWINFEQILDDVKRFGHFDVYWCFPPKHEVHKYVNILGTNNKEVKKTFILFVV